MNLKDQSVFSGKTLDYFIQLTETMNYTYAAQKLGISQPALTQRIKKFERALGVPLFYFKGREMRLTDAGRVMVRATQSVQTTFKNAIEDIEYLENEKNGHLKIGLLSSIEDGVFMDFIASYYGTFPTCKVSLYLLSREEIWHQLEKNQIDFAILCLPEDTIKNWTHYSSKIIVAEELFLLHQSAELKDRVSVRLNETTNHKWVFYPRNFYVNDILRFKFVQHNLDLPLVSGYFSTPRQLQLFSQKTNSLSALPKSYIDAHPLENDQQMLPFDPPITYTLAFVYQKEKRTLDRVNQFFTYFDKFLEEKDYASRLKS
ncbi:LysR substrate-binding domain-containing protein [Desemzia sp. FAM 23991]|uniref:LysR substrate-binding domain-containing protein n=1 Tax=unclassified Desemzia TaxID=2685243 RepID=UPI003885630F